MTLASLMDPAANDNREPSYLTILKGIAFGIVILVLFGILGTYVVMPPASEEASTTAPIATASTSPVIDVNENIELFGTQVCLPHKDTAGPQTEECAIGLKAEDGYIYGLDTSGLQPDAIGELYGGARVRIVGYYVPAEALSTNQYQKYTMRGIVRVNIVERI